MLLFRKINTKIKYITGGTDNKAVKILTVFYMPA